MASYRPLLLMSSSMPDRRRVSLAPVNTLAPYRITLDETVGMAFLVVLESMTPAERVASSCTMSSAIPSSK